MDLFLGGSETTSTSLNWTILYLLHYPEVHGLKSTILNIMLTVGIFFFKKGEILDKFKFTIPWFFKLPSIFLNLRTVGMSA